MLWQIELGKVLSGRSLCEFNIQAIELMPVGTGETKRIDLVGSCCLGPLPAARKDHIPSNFGHNLDWCSTWAKAKLSSHMWNYFHLHRHVCSLNVAKIYDHVCKTNNEIVHLLADQPSWNGTKTSRQWPKKCWKWFCAQICPKSAMMQIIFHYIPGFPDCLSTCSSRSRVEQYQP